VRLAPTLHDIAVGYAAESRPRAVGGVLSVLWALAGAAMLGLTLFLGVLVVAGIGLLVALEIALAFEVAKLVTGHAY